MYLKPLDPDSYVFMQQKFPAMPIYLILENISFDRKKYLTLVHYTT